MTSDQIFDCIIVGDGPAGLSAGIYISRAQRSNLIIGSGSGRWHFGQINQNYLGFPEGIAVDELRSLGLDQARKYGSGFLSAKVEKIEFNSNIYKIYTSNEQVFFSRTIIYSTGVTDRWPKDINIEEQVGKNIFWCITCDGYRAVNKPILIVADKNSSVETIRQFLDYTSDIIVVNDMDSDGLITDNVNMLRKLGIKVLVDSIIKINSDDSGINSVSLGCGDVYPVMIFSLLGSTPNTELARMNNLCELDARGSVIIDDKNRTNNPSFFAAGDVTNRHSHQVVTAVHEGAQAAQAATYYLYKNY